MILNILNICGQTIDISSSTNNCLSGQTLEPNNINDCFKRSSSSYKCCALINTKNYKNIPNNICWGFSTDNTQDIFTYLGYNYKVVCQDKYNNSNNLSESFDKLATQNDVKTCGIENPKIDGDCTQFSDDTGSCCYYMYNSIRSCTKLSIRFNGIFDYGGLTLMCYSQFMKVLRFLVLFLIFIILF